MKIIEKKSNLNGKEIRDLDILVHIVGGNDDVAKNAREAERTCGSGKVKSVSKDGFECK